MISLASEFTDRKSRHARGWLFYDADCRFCTRVAGLLVAPMRRRGLAIAPLQDPRVAALLGLPQQELLAVIRFVDSSGHQSSGADAFVVLARELWWARPLAWISNVPWARPVLRAAYRSIADRRKCGHLDCSVAGD